MALLASIDPPAPPPEGPDADPPAEAPLANTDDAPEPDGYVTP